MGSKSVHQIPFVKSVWFIRKDDTHSTLDVSQYDNPQHTSIHSSKERRYHRDAYGFPTKVDIPSGKFHIQRFSQHALDEYQKDDLYNEFMDGSRPPDEIYLEEGDIFEIATNDGRISKYVARYDYDETRDLTFVLTLD